MGLCLTSAFALCVAALVVPMRKGVRALDGL
jgi:hypothetical protein